LLRLLLFKSFFQLGALSGCLLPSLFRGGQAKLFAATLVGKLTLTSLALKRLKIPIGNRALLSFEFFSI
jgi:hypothetical protein